MRIMDAENLAKMLVRAIRKSSGKIKLSAITGFHKRGEVVESDGRRVRLDFKLVHMFEIPDSLENDRKLRAEINKCIKEMIFTYKENAGKVVLFGCLAEPGKRNGTRNFVAQGGNVSVKVSTQHDPKKEETAVKMMFIFGTYQEKT